MKAYLEACVDFIEDQLQRGIQQGQRPEALQGQPLGLDAISRAIGFSKYYLNAMFSMYTGMSLMQYARKRKLYYGLVAYCRGSRLVDVAEALGYSSERAFARAVVKDFGRSPSYFRSKGAPASQRLVIYDLGLTLPEDLLEHSVPISQMGIQRQLREKGVAQMKNYLSDVSYVVLPAMTVLSGVAEGKEPEDAIIGLMNRLAAHYQLDVSRAFGFDVPVEGEHDAMEYRAYEYWLVVSEETLAAKEISSVLSFEGTEILRKHIPSYRYATLAIDDPFSAPFERIPGGWRALMTWLETRDFKDSPAGAHFQAQCLEEVVESAGEGASAGGGTVMRIYIPVGQ